MLCPVRGFAFLRLLALVVWLTASIHCRLASLPGLDFLTCATAGEAHAQDADCPVGEDDCDSVESGRYRSEEPASLVPPSQQFTAGLPIPLGLIPTPLGREEAPPRETSPPPRSWHLLLRASGSPRAPSLPG